jgi:hypothetical protein
MNTVGPAISLRTSCWLFPQKEQYRVFLESPPLPPLTLLISLSFQHSAYPPVQTVAVNFVAVDTRGRHAAPVFAQGVLYRP